MPNPDISNGASIYLRFEKDFPKTNNLKELPRKGGNDFADKFDTAFYQFVLSTVQSLPWEEKSL